MFQLNLPKKLTARIQVWTCVLLLFVLTGLSLAPIITLRLAGNEASFDKMLNEIAPNVELQIPEQIDVSAVKIVKSVGVGVDIVKATSGVIQLSKNMADVDKTVAFTVLSEKIESILETDEGRDALLIALSFASTVTSNFGTESLNGAGLMTDVAAMLITLLALIAFMIFTFVIPIVFLFSAIGALISALAHPLNPEKAAVKVSKKLLGYITLPLTLLLIQPVVPGMTYGSGVLAIGIVTALAAVLGVVVSRLHSYEPMAFRYLNVVQGTSVLGVVGFCVFFFNLIKTDIFTTFLGGKFADYLASVTKLTSGARLGSLKINNSYLIDLGLILLYVCLALVSVTYLKKCVLRMSCASKANKKGVFPKDTCIGRAIMIAAVYAIPAYIMSAKHFYYDPRSTAAVGDASLLELQGDQRSAFNLVLVGVILMLVAEIALIVLKLVFCRGMDEQEIEAVMSGEAEADEMIDSDETDAETADVDNDADNDADNDVDDDVDNVDADDEDAAICEDALEDQNTSEDVIEKF